MMAHYSFLYKCMYPEHLLTSNARVTQRVTKVIVRFCTDFQRLTTGNGIYFKIIRINQPRTNALLVE